MLFIWYSYGVKIVNYFRLQGYLKVMAFSFFKEPFIICGLPDIFAPSVAPNDSVSAPLYKNMSGGRQNVGWFPTFKRQQEQVNKSPADLVSRGGRREFLCSCTHQPVRQPVEFRVRS